MLIEERGCQGGIQKIYRFENGYGASVVRHQYSYGNEEGLWEIAVTRYQSPNNDRWSICYDTPLTNDVLGYLTQEEVDTHLAEIEALPVVVVDIKEVGE